MFAFTPKKILTITKSAERIQLVEASLEGERLKVHAFAKISELGDTPAKIVEQLKETLQKKEIKTKTAYVGLISDNLKFKRIIIPVMGKQQILTAVKQTAAKEHGLPIQQLRFSYKVIQEFQDKGMRRYEVLVASALKKEVEELEDLLIKAQLKPLLITAIVSSFAFNNFPKRKVSERLPSEAQAFVYLSPEYSVMTFLQEGWYVFSRGFITPKIEAKEDLAADFFLSKEREVGGTSEMIEEKTEDRMETQLTGEELFRVCTEISRSLRFFQQNYRDFSITQMILCGRSVDMESMKMSLGNVNFTIHEYSDLAQVQFPKLSKLDNLEKTSLYAKELGLFWGIVFGDKLNFIPAPTFIKKFRVALGVLAGAIFFILMVASLLLMREINTLDSSIQTIQQNMSQSQLQKQNLQTAATHRENHQHLLKLVKREVFQAYHLSDLPFRKISQSSPQTLTLETINLQLTEFTWSGNLAGKIIETDSERALISFKNFHDAIKASPLFKEWQVAPIDIKILNSQANLTFKVTFTLNPIPVTN